MGDRVVVGPVPEKLLGPAGLGAFPGADGAAGVAVVVVLVDDAHEPRDVDDGGTLVTGLPDEPVVVTGAADGERRDLVQRAPVEREPVDAEIAPLAALGVGPPGELRVPLGVGEVDRFG